MQIPPEFSSPILQENTSKIYKDRMLKGALIRHFANALYSIAYNLEQAIPKGSTICAFYPKTILQHILPKIAQQKNCKVIVIGGEKEATQALLEAGVLNKYSCLEDADIFLTEPDGLTTNGILARPEETKLLHQYNPMAVASILQWTTTLPATHDQVHAAKIISEIGIHTPENFKEEINVFSWLKPSIPYPTLQSQIATP